MMRRDLLTGAFVGAVGSTMAFLAGKGLAQPNFGHAVDPHPAWLIEWREARAEWPAAVKGKEETPESEALWNRRIELGDLISATPPRSPAGAFAQISWVLEDADDNGDMTGTRAQEALVSFAYAMVGLQPELLQ